MVHEYEDEQQDIDELENDPEELLDNDEIDPAEQAFLEGVEEDYEEDEEEEEEDEFEI